MRDRDLYAQILGIASPWHVTEVRLDVPAGRAKVLDKLMVVDVIRIGHRRQVYP